MCVWLERMLRGVVFNGGKGEWDDKQGKRRCVGGVTRNVAWKKRLWRESVGMGDIPIWGLEHGVE